MPRRHPSLPMLWLMTDERIGDLLRVVKTLPRGAGIVFRHYATPPAARRTLFAQVAKVARRNKLVLIRAGAASMPGENGVHGSARQRQGRLRTWPAHSRAEAVAGVRAGANLLFVSPVFATRSHPGASALGPHRAGRIMRQLNIPTIALGGMNAHRFRRLSGLGFYGWAAIDAWTTNQKTARQKRNAVPI